MCHVLTDITSSALARTMQQASNNNWRMKGEGVGASTWRSHERLDQAAVDSIGEGLGASAWRSGKRPLWGAEVDSIGRAQEKR